MTKLKTRKTDASVKEFLNLGVITYDMNLLPAWWVDMLESIAQPVLSVQATES